MQNGDDILVCNICGAAKPAKVPLPEESIPADRPAAKTEEFVLQSEPVVLESQKPRTMVFKPAEEPSSDAPVFRPAEATNVMPPLGSGTVYADSGDTRVFGRPKIPKPAGEVFNIRTDTPGTPGGVAVRWDEAKPRKDTSAARAAEDKADAERRQKIKFAVRAALIAVNAGLIIWNAINLVGVLS